MNADKDFVPYQPSLDMKEIGFNEPCFATYDEDKNFELQDFFQTYETFPSHIVAAPTFSQAFRWFREKYGVHMYPTKFDETKWWIQWGTWTSKVFDTFEEAELDCLKKLIEIVKQ